MCWSFCALLYLLKGTKAPVISKNKMLLIITIGALGVIGVGFLLSLLHL